MAWQKGARFDGWSDCFSYERWLEAISDAGLDKDFYAARERGENEAFPWEHISPGVSRRFLWNEWRKAYAQQLTHDWPSRKLHRLWRLPGIGRKNC